MESKELMVQLPAETFNKTLEIINKIDERFQTMNAPAEIEKSNKIMNYSKQGASKSVIAFRGWNTELGSAKTDIEECYQDQPAAFGPLFLQSLHRIKLQ